MTCFIKLSILLSAFVITQAVVAAPALDTVLVLIDKRTEQNMGPFPYERDVLSKGIEKLSQLGAREILLKLFLDTNTDKSTDKQLADSFKTIPVTLQARIDDKQRKANPLLPEHKLSKEFILKSSIRGDSGWLPIIGFSQNAKAVGFIDSIYPAYFVETYQDDAVGSLYFHALESIYGTKIVLKGNQLYLGNIEIMLNAKSEYNYDWIPHLQYEHISFIDIMQSRVSADRVAGKYVILGYNGKFIHQVATPEGPMNAHIAFYKSLLSILAGIE